MPSLESGASRHRLEVTYPVMSADQHARDDTRDNPDKHLDFISHRIFCDAHYSQVPVRFLKPKTPQVAVV